MANSWERVVYGVAGAAYSASFIGGVEVQKTSQPEAEPKFALVAITPAGGLRLTNALDAEAVEKVRVWLLNWLHHRSPAPGAVGGVLWIDRLVAAAMANGESGSKDAS